MNNCESCPLAAEEEISTRPVFTEDMKSSYTILVPNMLPMHFRMLMRILGKYGYHAEFLETSGRHIVDCGLKYVHNDTCYPALLVIGQFLDALESGKYDPHKVALMLSQTGGGCRASNYIYLLRKALDKAGYPYIPVISFNLSGLKDNPGMKFTVPMLARMGIAVIYGDLLMMLRNQCVPYEKEKGASEALAQQWTTRLTDEMDRAGAMLPHVIKRNFRKIIADFAAIPRTDEEKVKVGIVGEIFVKFSPLGNNNLEEFLVSEGAEVRMPGLLDFCLYTCYDGIMDRKLYGTSRKSYLLNKIAFKFLLLVQRTLIRAVNKEGTFTPPSPFPHAIERVKDYIGLGAKMGEGWLLPAEMLELIDGGVPNIVCAQPFGCLPNHVMGKGMMKPLKEKNPGVNIVAVDYDPGATKINQENRIKLMLANARGGNEPPEKATIVFEA